MSTWTDTQPWIDSESFDASHGDWAGSDLWVGSEAWLHGAVTHIAPSSIAAITNLTPNDITYIQDSVTAPDANTIIPVDAAQNSSILINFTPPPNKRFAAGAKTFHVRLAPAGSSTQVRLELYQGGVATGVFTTHTVNSAEVVTLNWNTTDLPNADGAAQLYIASL